MEPYRSYFPHAWLVLPETETLVTRVLSLPTGTAVGQEEIREICQIIRIAVSRKLEDEDALTGHFAMALHLLQETLPVNMRA